LNNWFCVVSQPPTLLWGGGLFFKPVNPEEAVTMEVRLYVGNLSKVTTEQELNTLFMQAGDVASVDVIKDRKSGDSKGFAFITMSAQSEADKAISMFNTYSLRDHALKVNLVKPREQRGFGALN
jgi:RNA recognition motif-containing protein